MEMLDAIADALNPHAPLIELVVAPVVLFIWLLRLRDREEVPHVPFADFAVLIALIDVALFIEPRLLNALSGSFPGQPPHLRQEFLGLLGADLVVAKLLVVKMEKVMVPIMMQEMDVGLLHPLKVRKAESIAGRWNRNWWAYSWRLAASWGMLAVLIALHGRTLLDPLDLGTHGLVSGITLTSLWGAAVLGTAVSVLLISLVLSGVGFVRFATEPAHFTVRGKATDRLVL